jgi:transcription antitermination factor NusG
MEMRDKKWYAIKVKFRSEKLVMSQLANKGIEAYTPMRPIVRRYARKLVRRNLPVFSTYVFVHIDYKDYVRVLETEYVYGFVKIGRQLEPVKESEMSLIRRIEGLGIDYTTTEIDFKAGQKVRINNGALLGMEGIVRQIKSKGKMIVHFESFGIALMIEINKNQLEAIAS